MPDPLAQRACRARSIALIFCRWHWWPECKRPSRCRRHGGGVDRSRRGEVSASRGVKAEGSLPSFVSGEQLQRCCLASGSLIGCDGVETNRFDLVERYSPLLLRLQTDRAQHDSCRAVLAAATTSTLLQTTEIGDRVGVRQPLEPGRCLHIIAGAAYAVAQSKKSPTQLDSAYSSAYTQSTDRISGQASTRLRDSTRRRLRGNCVDRLLAFVRQ